MKKNIFIKHLISVFLILFCFCSCSQTYRENDMQSDLSAKSDSSANDIKTGSDAKNDESKDNKTGEYCRIIDSVMSDADGKVSYAFHIYNKDISFVSNSEIMKSASVIKLFIMEYAFSLIEKGELTSDYAIRGQTVSSLIEKMITVSDNDSTNALIDFFGMEKLNRYFSENGYPDTSIGRRMLDFKAQSEGKDNFTSSGDVLKFLDKLYFNKEKFPQKDMLEIMKRQRVDTKIRKNLPHGTVIANKTGELSDVENDAGIIFADNSDFAIVILTNEVKNSENTRNLIAEAASDIYEKVKEF